MTELFDTLVVVNGPEDGASFPLVRAPFTVGNDGTCAVCVRLDSAVDNVHARGTCSSDGYRVRSSTKRPVFVNGSRAGMVRSRLLKHGDTLKVGHTELILECTPGGLAKRSAGIVTDNDLVWAVRRGLRMGWSTLSYVFIGLRAVGALLVRYPKTAIILAAAAAYFYFPPFHNIVRTVIEMGRALIDRVF